MDYRGGLYTEVHYRWTCTRE